MIQENVLLKERQKLVRVIKHIFHEILITSEHIPKGESMFHLPFPPNKNISQYFDRLQRYLHCQSSSYVIALVLIDRFLIANQEFNLNKYCIHKLFLTAVVIAISTNEQPELTIQYCAKVGGINKEEMDRLRFQFLEKINFQTVVLEDFKLYLNRLNQYDQALK